MAVTKQAGLNGVVEVEGNAVGGIREISVELERKDLDAGSFGDDFEVVLVSRGKGKGSMKGVSVIGDPNGQSAVVTAFMNKTQVTLIAGPASGNAGTYEVFFTKVKEMSKFDGLAEFEADFVLAQTPTTNVSHS